MTRGLWIGLGLILVGMLLQIAALVMRIMVQ